MWQAFLEESLPACGILVAVCVEGYWEQWSVRNCFFIVPSNYSRHMQSLAHRFLSVEMASRLWHIDNYYVWCAGAQLPVLRCCNLAGLMSPTLIIEMHRLDKLVLMMYQVILTT